MGNHIPLLTQSTITNVRFGSGVKIVEPVNLYGCDIGSDCFIGPFVEIQNKVTLGERIRVQSHTFICSLVTIGNDCFISHGCMFVNDDFRHGGPAKGDQAKWSATTVADHVSIGSNATILPVNICENVVIGAGSVVTSDIQRPGIYAGNPARFLRDLS